MKVINFPQVATAADILAEAGKVGAETVIVVTLKKRTLEIFSNVQTAEVYWLLAQAHHVMIQGEFNGE